MRKREKREERKTSREDVKRHEAFQARVAARNKTSWSLKSSLNVTQAAAHKGEMERKRHAEKKNTITSTSVGGKLPCDSVWSMTTFKLSLS